MPAATQQQQVPVGTYFGLPGFTQPFEQYENLNNITTNLALAAQTPWNPPGSFQKTDIVKWWEMETIVSFSATLTAGALTPSAPWSLFQSFKLKLQGQYTPVEVESGQDLAFFQMYRPMRGQGQQDIQDLLGFNTAGVNGSGTAGATPIPEGWPSPIPGSAYSAANAPYQIPASIPGAVQAAQPSGTSFTFILEVPGGLFLDAYWDQAIDGTLLPNAQGRIAPMSAFVSPQYMGGGERVVVPTFNYAALAAVTADQGPWTASSAGAAAVVQNCRRVGYYGSANPAELPPVFNWQYRRASKRYPAGAFTKIDIPVTEYGQLLSVYVRGFDPTAGVGSPINLANVTKCQLLYGSNLPRFDDDIATMQKRFIDQHGFLPPQGVMVWDMLANTSGANGLSNDFKVLNTLTNANTHIHVEISSAPGTGTYFVIGTELLVPVATQ